MASIDSSDSHQDIFNFIEALAEAHSQIERSINILLRKQEDPVGLHNLFHTYYLVRSCAVICELPALARFATPMENIANKIRARQMPLTAELAEVLLLGLDRLKLAAEATAAESTLAPLNLESLAQSMQVIADTMPHSGGGIVQKTLGLFADKAFEPGKENIAPQALQAATATAVPPVPETPAPIPVTPLLTPVAPAAPEKSAPPVKAAAAAATPAAPKPAVTTPKASISPAANEQDPLIKKDLDFFHTLAKITERRSPFLEGRTDRVLDLALRINEAAGNKIAPVQLKAAVYMHDVGMAFLSDALWSKQGKFTELEFKELKSHPAIASQLLTRMPAWQDAANMVMQHHERIDGAGYPFGLKGQNIHPGAKLIAIVDAFEAMTHERGDRYQRRSVMRAITEINISETQFAREWMAAFNQIVKSTLQNAAI